MKKLAIKKTQIVFYSFHGNSMDRYGLCTKFSDGTRIKATKKKLPSIV